MKELTITVSEKMYNELNFLKEEGFDIDSVVQRAAEEMIQDFHRNPVDFIKKINELENKFQAENGIN
jgi:hypothetical protein